MSHNASENYLVNEVMTATPQKLHLMLLDAVNREGERARRHWQAGEDEKAGKCVLRAQKIVYGIIDGIDYKTKSELVGKVAGVYLFIYASLTRAFIDNDESKLDEALRVLAIERETWRQMCEKLAESPGMQTPPQAGHAPHAPDLQSNGGLLPDLPTASFSLEA
jgi:flagellar biosynthetic protein FliS